MSGAAQPATSKRGAWRAVDPETGDLVFVLSGVLAGGGRRVAGEAGRDGAEAGGAAPVGAPRGVRSRGRVLMRIEQGGETEAA